MFVLFFAPRDAISVSLIQNYAPLYGQSNFFRQKSSIVKIFYTFMSNY